MLTTILSVLKIKIKQRRNTISFPLALDNFISLSPAAKKINPAHTAKINAPITANCLTVATKAYPPLSAISIISSPLPLAALFKSSEILSANAGDTKQRDTNKNSAITARTLFFFLASKFTHPLSLNPCWGLFSINFFCTFIAVISRHYSCNKCSY